MTRLPIPGSTCRLVLDVDAIVRAMSIGTHVNLMKPTYKHEAVYGDVEYVLGLAITKDGTQFITTEGHQFTVQSTVDGSIVTR